MALTDIGFKLAWSIEVFSQKKSEISINGYSSEEEGEIWIFSKNVENLRNFNYSLLRSAFPHKVVSNGISPKGSEPAWTSFAFLSGPGFDGRRKLSCDSVCVKRCFVFPKNCRDFEVEATLAILEILNSVRDTAQCSLLSISFGDSGPTVKTWNLELLIKEFRKHVGSSSIKAKVIVMDGRATYMAELEFRTFLGEKALSSSLVNPDSVVTEDKFMSLIPIDSKTTSVKKFTDGDQRLQSLLNAHFSSFDLLFAHPLIRRYISLVQIQKLKQWMVDDTSVVSSLESMEIEELLGEKEYCVAIIPELLQFQNVSETLQLMRDRLKDIISHFDQKPPTTEAKKALRLFFSKKCAGRITGLLEVFDSTECKKISDISIKISQLTD
jgi:hypothetical protein